LIFIERTMYDSFWIFIGNKIQIKFNFDCILHVF